MSLVIYIFFLFHERNRKAKNLAHRAVYSEKSYVINGDNRKKEGKKKKLGEKVRILYSKNNERMRRCHVHDLL